MIVKILNFHLFLFVVISIKSANGFYIQVDAHGQECFYETLSSGTKFLVMFEVIEGGFLDIDLTIVDPDQREVYRGQRESSGRATFSASMDGKYTLCFGNEMSTLTPKTVMFKTEIPESPKIDVVPESVSNNVSIHQNKLEKLVSELAASLANIKHEQEFMEVRQRIHREIGENTNQWVVIWSCFEAIILLTMAVGQVFYLKRFFEVRRVV